MDYYVSLLGNNANSGLGAEPSKALVARIEPVVGRQPLYVVVRSAVAEPIGVVSSIHIETHTT
jgi:hypothetical protein